MPRTRLDLALVQQRLVPTRSQAEQWIRLGRVKVGGKMVTKPGYPVATDASLELEAPEQYVSRAGLKLASVARLLNIEFTGKTVLDVGSSTGGFTDYALQHGAVHVDAVDVGTDQLHSSLRTDERIVLHEKTDIRDVSIKSEKKVQLKHTPDIIVIDVSFISIREVLPHIAQHLSDTHTDIIAMVKPQFEVGKQHVHKGVIKNDTIRRTILKDFETWAKQTFMIAAKADSDVPGAKGNRERFYKLRLQSKAT